MSPIFAEIGVHAIAVSGESAVELSVNLVHTRVQVPTAGSQHVLQLLVAVVVPRAPEGHLVGQRGHVSTDAVQAFLIAITSWFWFAIACERVSMLPSSLSIFVNVSVDWLRPSRSREGE